MQRLLIFIFFINPAFTILKHEILTTNVRAGFLTTLCINWQSKISSPFLTTKHQAISMTNIKISFNKILNFYNPIVVSSTKQHIIR